MASHKIKPCIIMNVGVFVVSTIRKIGHILRTYVRSYGQAGMRKITYG